MRSVKLLAVVLAASISVAGIGGYFSQKLSAADMYRQMISIQFATEEELQQRRNERDAALAEASNAAAMVSSLTAQQGELSEELESLNELDAEQREQYEVVAAQYAAALIAKADALNRYVAAQENLEQTQLMFSERLSVMFEYQNKSTLEVLLESDSLAGFFTNMEIIALIADADDQAVDQMQIALDDAQLQVDTALQEADDLEVVVQEKQDILADLEAGIALTTEQLNTINADLANWQSAQSSAAAMASMLDGQIAQLQREIDAQNAAAAAAQAQAQAQQQAQQQQQPQEETPAESGTIDAGEAAVATPVPTATPVPVPQGTGQFVWPLYTWSYISSEFGYRYHPISGVWKYHAGMDIASGYGNTIIAAASGTVVYVETPVPGQNTGGSGYGNYFIIDHGNGVYTLYGHCRDVYVTTGQYVSQGESCGTVGSTGGSTGSHLHFECRTGGAWGTAVDPRNYL